MLQSIGSQILYEYKEKKEAQPLFLFIPACAIILFLFTQKTLFLFLAAGVHLPHLILALVFLPVMVVLYWANSLYLFVTGKNHSEIFDFYKDVYKYSLYVFFSLLCIPRQIAPFFRQDDEYFDFTLQISSSEENKQLYRLSGFTGLTIVPNKYKRFFAFLRLTGFILLPLLLHIAFLVLLTLPLFFFALVNIAILIFNSKQTPQWLKNYFEYYFVNFIYITAFLLGFSNKFPVLFYNIKKVKTPKNEQPV